MKNNQEYLDAINIFKGIAFSQMMLQDNRLSLIQSSNIDYRAIFDQIQPKGLGKIYPIDITKFLSVHRIAISERQAQYLIYAMGSKTNYITYQNFQWYFTNGYAGNGNNMAASQINYFSNTKDELIKNFGERQVAKILQKQIEFYRTIEYLKEDFVKKHGFIFKEILPVIDSSKKGRIDINNLIPFVNRFGVQLSTEQFTAIAKKIFAKDYNSITYKQAMRALSPFQPINFPIYRKKNNFQKAMEYINERVSELQINIQPLPYEQSDLNKQKTRTGFNKVMDNYRNTGIKNDNLTNKYFYDQNYYNELRQYKASYFEPNKQVKKKVQADMIGPQYHDHFFSNYYMYLDERNKAEHYYNKFGKRYAYENQIDKMMDAKN